MQRFLQTLRNIWQIDELRQRITFTVLMILVYRVGSYVVLPGIDPTRLAELSRQGGKGIMSIFNLFAGGAFTRASIFALGIMPYISASIFMQLLAIAVPAVQKMQKEGESGRRQINNWTRMLTVGVAAFQASGYVVYLNSLGGEHYIQNATLFYFSTVFILTAGTIFLMWVGEKITDKGLGNGTSLLIMVNIISRLPIAFSNEWTSRLNEGGGLVMFLAEIAFLLAVVVGVILLVQGTRKIPLQFAKRVVGNRQYGGGRNFLPLKVNTAGVMPIIFAQSIMLIPATIAQFFPKSDMAQGITAFTDHTGFWYNIVEALLIVAFTYFYTALIINPVQMADDLKRNGGFIPGVKPGKPTSHFIDNVMSRITLPGAIFLALVSAMPALAKMMKVSTEFANFFGGTSLLILVGVILDTLQQVESHLLMRHYDGLMKTGKIKGRTSLPTSTQAANF